MRQSKHPVQTIVTRLRGSAAPVAWRTGGSGPLAHRDVEGDQ